MRKAKPSAAQDDKKLQGALKKLNVQPIPGVEEVNMFREDGNVLHFTAPKGKLLKTCYFVPLLPSELCNLGEPLLNKFEFSSRCCFGQHIRHLWHRTRKGAYRARPWYP